MKNNNAKKEDYFKVRYYARNIGTSMSFIQAALLKYLSQGDLNKTIKFEVVGICGKCKQEGTLNEN